MLTGRVFRLFVSSTFSDFIAEREALQKEVFPQLDRYCAERGARFEAVDLRWGITEEAQREHDTMRICLEEVRRCQQLSPRPNFAVLLGDRYGWEPAPARITQAHWSRLEAAASADDWALIRASYRLDENAIPPVYCLEDRGEDVGQALTHEGLLLQALRRTARGFRGDARLPYFTSATHQEIVLGALSRRDAQGRDLQPEQHVHVYVRHIEALPNHVSAKDYLDWDSTRESVVPGARARLRGLDRQLRKRLGNHVHTLGTHWHRHGRDGAVDRVYLQAFCEAFLSHQMTLIEAELVSLPQADTGHAIEAAHQNFGAERARVFAGRSALEAGIMRHIQAQDSPEPLVLIGLGGSGKSALLARAAQEDRRQATRTGAVIVQRYIGGVPGTESLMTMLSDLVASLARLYSKPIPPVAQSVKALAQDFESALGYASARRPLHLYLDALDQLDSDDGAWMLEWLPRVMPAHVRLVASTRAGTVVEQSVRRRYADALVMVPAMSSAEGEAMLAAWMADRRTASFNAGIAPATGRRLTGVQQQAVLAGFNANGSALWLKLAYEEAAGWASWDAPRYLPPTVEGLIGDLIDRRLIERENHPAVFTHRALAYLTAGRQGLSEAELARALGVDRAVRAEFQNGERTQRKWEDTQSLPPILWSRLFFDLQPYLGQAQVDGALVLRWFHREFGDALRRRYLSEVSDQAAIHGTLADVFKDLERESRPAASNDDALFRATDAAGTQISAALRRVMEQPWQLARAGRQQDLQALITDFGFCMGKCGGNRAHDLAADFLAWTNRGPSSEVDRAWREIVQGQGHLLRRGTTSWPAHKILLQIASEHAEDSAVTLAAQNWLDTGHCDWMWVRHRPRASKFQPSPLLRTLVGHTRSINGLRILPSNRLLTWSDDHTLRLWDNDSGVPLAVLEGHTDGVKGIQEMSGSRVLSWCRSLEKRDGDLPEWADAVDYTLRIWDSQTGTPIALLPGHTNSINGALVLSDGRILSWSADCTLRLWQDSNSFDSVVMAGHAQAVRGACVVPDGRILSWSQDGTLRLWDAQTGAAQAVLSGHEKTVRGAHPLPDDRILSWSEDGTLRLWEGRRGAEQAVMLGHTRSVRGARVLPDGRILSWSNDGTARLWDASTGAALVTLAGHGDWVNGGHALPDGRILTWSDDLKLRLWDGSSGALLQTWEGHQGAALHALPLADGRVLSWSSDGPLRLWEPTTGQLVGLLDGHTESVVGAQFIGVGRVASWSADKTIRLWDVQAGGELAEAEVAGHRANVGGYVVVPEGRVLSWSRDGDLRLWDGAQGIPLAVLEGHADYVWSAQYLPDDRVLSWSGDGTLRLWDGRTGQPLHVLAGHTQDVRGARVLPDGRLLSWSRDATLRLWDGQTGAPLSVLSGHTSYVESAQVLPDGRLLSWSGDATLRVWDGVHGEPLAVMRGHSDAPGLVRVLPDGRVLSGVGAASLFPSDDHTLRLWDCTSGLLTAMLDGHEGAVLGVLVLPDGHIVSWSADLTLRLWRGADGAALAVMRGPARMIHDVKMLPDGLLISCTSDGTLVVWDVTRSEPLQSFAPPWLKSPDVPASWTSAIARLKFRGARYLGGVWVVYSRDQLVLCDPKQEWQARWHGLDIESPGFSGTSHVVRCGSQLRFTGLMRGSGPGVSL